MDREDGMGEVTCPRCGQCVVFDLHGARDFPPKLDGYVESACAFHSAMREAGLKARPGYCNWLIEAALDEMDRQIAAQAQAAARRRASADAAGN